MSIGIHEETGWSLMSAEESAMRAGIYQRACASNMACNVRTAGAPSMDNTAKTDISGPAITNSGPAPA